MAIIKGKGSQSSAVQRLSEGQAVYLRALRDGSLVGANWKIAAIFQGLGFTVPCGTLTSPITGGGGETVIEDTLEPEFMLSIPTGTSVMPLRIEVTCHTPVLHNDADECEILLSVDQDTAYDGATGGGTAEVIHNMNTLRPNASLCTFHSAVSTDMNACVHDIDLMHIVITGDVGGSSTAQLWGSLYGLYEPKAPPIINGPARLVCHWGGTTNVTGFANVQWIEFPSTFSSL